MEVKTEVRKEAQRGRRTKGNLSIKQFVEREAFPPTVQRTALMEAFAYVTNYFAGKGKLTFCLMCGRWFLASRPQTRCCSAHCRRRLESIVYQIRLRKRREITQKLRKTPFYFFLYLAIQDGVLPAELLNREKPEDLPPPIITFIDLLDIVGLTPTQVGKQITQTAERLLPEGEKREGEKEKEGGVYDG